MPHPVHPRSGRTRRIWQVRDCHRRGAVSAFDKYGPVQRLYTRRGYVPDGRGACRGQVPLSDGARVIMDGDLIIWKGNVPIAARDIS